MKTFLLDIFSKIQQYSMKLDDLTLLTNQHWVVIDEIENSKNIYIFRSNNELLISNNGKVSSQDKDNLATFAKNVDHDLSDLNVNFRSSSFWLRSG